MNENQIKLHYLFGFIYKMSSSLSAPWIKRSVLDVLLSQEFVSRPSRICQVTSVDEKLQQITISDTQSEILGYLTSECVASILSDCESLKNLKYCIIKLESYHFSTVLQCFGNRNAAILAHEMRTRPVVLQITKLSNLGASDSSVIGCPCGVGENPDVRHHLPRSLGHWSDLLVTRQFRTEHSLPDYRGYFTTPAVYSAIDPLSVEDCHVNEPEQELLKTLQKFDALENLIAHPDAIGIVKATGLEATELLPNSIITTAQSVSMTTAMPSTQTEANVNGTSYQFDIDNTQLASYEESQPHTQTQSQFHVQVVDHGHTQTHDLATRGTQMLPDLGDFDFDAELGTLLLNTEVQCAEDVYRLISVGSDAHASGLSASVSVNKDLTPVTAPQDKISSESFGRANEHTQVDSGSADPHTALELAGLFMTQVAHEGNSHEVVRDSTELQQYYARAIDDILSSPAGFKSPRVPAEFPADAVSDDPGAFGSISDAALVSDEMLQSWSEYAGASQTETEAVDSETLRKYRRDNVRESSQLRDARLQFQRQVRARIQDTQPEPIVSDFISMERFDESEDAESLQRTQVQGGGSQDDKEPELEPNTRMRNQHTIQRIAHSSSLGLSNVDADNTLSSSLTSFHDDFPLLARLSDGSIRYLPRQTSLYFGDCALQDSSVTASLATISNNSITSAPTTSAVTECHCYVCTLLRPIH